MWDQNSVVGSWVEFLLALASTVILDFETRLNARLYFSFQDF
jgi:hypothetical protein